MTIPWLTRREAARSFSLPDERIEALPEISRHDHPQDGPQEYDCGCVAVAYVTDREGGGWNRGPSQLPFEMRLAVPCDLPLVCCYLMHLRDA